jgi:hypothetical protein
MKDILILYYSVHGGTRTLAESMAQGVAQVPGALPRVRTVPRVSTVAEQTAPSIPDEGRLMWS